MWRIEGMMGEDIFWQVREGQCSVWTTRILPRIDAWLNLSQSLKTLSGRAYKRECGQRNPGIGGNCVWDLISLNWHLEKIIKCESWQCMGHISIKRVWELVRAKNIPNNLFSAIWYLTLPLEVSVFSGDVYKMELLWTLEWRRGLLGPLSTIALLLLQKIPLSTLPCNRDIASAIWNFLEKCLEFESTEIRPEVMVADSVERSIKTMASQNFSMIDLLEYMEISK